MWFTEMKHRFSKEIWLTTIHRALQFNLMTLYYLHQLIISLEKHKIQKVECINEIL